ncbi:RHS repeat domain-containing protein [Cognatilysobacter terrigena]|uniref:RHS repeat domain-containing protein n=1 Tax=Cognatilysobacter terrigena TaxID=2488749 RepID=UPI001FE2AAEE|nr:RHS repeat-associated core domain-containing protein [Lysobacter terrigena]
MRSSKKSFFGEVSALAVAMAFAQWAPGAAAQTARTDSTLYRDDLTNWVIGQVQTQSSTGVLRDNAGVSVETDRVDFDARSLPWRTYKFGKLQSTVTYNADGTIATVTDGNNNVMSLSGWKRGIPQLVTFADSTTKAAQVNDDGAIDWIDDEIGARTCYGYDRMMRVNLITYPSESALHTCNADKWSQTTVTYEPMGIVEYGIPAGHWRRLEQTGNYRKLTYYDAFLQPIVEEDVDTSNMAGTNRWSVKRYDDDGHVVFSSYPRNPFQDGSLAWSAAMPGLSTTYDSLGRATRVDQSSELGTLTTTTEYQANSKTLVTNPRQKTTVNTYQAFDQPAYEVLLRSEMPEGAVVEIARNSLGMPFAIRKRSADSSVVATRQYVYDASSVGGMTLCKAIEPETRASTYAYDGAGNLTWSVAGLEYLSTTSCDRDAALASGRAVRRTYDSRNRLSTLSFPDKNGDQGWAYWPDGTPKRVTTLNDGGTTSIINAYSYNTRRLLSGESVTHANGAIWSLGYGYDANGGLSTQTYPTGSVLAYAPNAMGQATQVRDVNGYTWASGVQYYPNGAIRQFTYGNGIVHSMAQNARQLPARSSDIGGSGTPLDYTYVYDKNGNVSSIADAAQGVNYNRTMTYDDADRLITASSPSFGGDGVHRFTYDALDNLKSWKLAGVKDYANYYYEPATQRLMNLQNSAGASVVGFGYDPQGNLSNKNGQAYGFDYGNRLRYTADKETYRYDAAGRRVFQGRPAGIFGATPSQTVELYSNNGQLMYDEKSRDTGTTTEHYVYLGGSLIAVSEWLNTTNVWTPKYQHTDALGSPVAVTNSNAQVIDRTQYEPYGATVGKSVDGPGFTGHSMDAATGLAYMQQRYYDPSIGRFLSSDPVATSVRTGANFNRYAYANSNPYRFKDPDGRRCATADGKYSCTVDEFRDKNGNVVTREQATSGGSKLAKLLHMDRGSRISRAEAAMTAKYAAAKALAARNGEVTIKGNQELGIPDTQVSGSSIVSSMEAIQVISYEGPSAASRPGYTVLGGVPVTPDGSPSKGPMNLYSDGSGIDVSRTFGHEMLHTIYSGVALPNRGWANADFQLQHQASFDEASDGIR